MKNLQDPTNNAFVTNLFESAKRNRYKQVVKKQPVTPELLVTLCDKYSESTDILVVRDLCMILLGFSAFLRYDEISNVRCNDIRLEDSHFCLNIKKAKRINTDLETRLLFPRDTLLHVRIQCCCAIRALLIRPFPV